ncbi:NACHT domain-containing protein [Dactylosporangium matsuzakiense]|uniref:NACHT domain-containing protein n=1 Tax=Dactylosporangium matsuzakiense TaxID=53360 RepID=A0A9W6NRB9_9ACTN|nr:NACHT domain-containing protein [Dactylosporangium matsuzakiense]UWZ47733.1 NACHT domain-containing protein [Dactylosporangium matsuzakiense]GLL06116.1 hypothetical protein GCM10017581_078640 [Dactylosporangium matsuzakiense]
MTLPQLPFGLTYPAIGVFALAVLTAILQQVFSDQVQRIARFLWRRATLRRAMRRADGWTRYAAWVARTYNTTRLGFVESLHIALDAVYVPLQYERDGNRIDVYRDIQRHHRTVVVGGAGAGKSTVLRQSMLQWALAPERFDRVPVLVELGRYNLGGRTIQQLLVEAFGHVEEPVIGRHGRTKTHARPLVEDAERVVPGALGDGRLCVFLDGLDEVVSDRRGDVALEIKEFAERYPGCQIVVTCRDSVYNNDLQPVFDHKIAVAGFDDAGIRRFLRRWFGRTKEAVEPALSAPDLDPRQQVEQLMAGLRSSPTLMRLARSPLMLTMIALLHDVDPGEGPMLTNSRAEFYEKAVGHLLSRDPDLGRYRQLTRYRVGHKLMALRAIALAAQGDLTPGSDHRVITQDEINDVMSRLRSRFQLPEPDLAQMINEIVERSGLLIRIDETNLLYEFAHLTLQEYLAAVELAAEPDRLLALYREQPARWRETVKLWCGGANRDATYLVGEIYTGDSRDRVLALECIAEAQQIDVDLASRIVNDFADRLGAPMPEKLLMLAALGSVAGNPGSIGEDLFDRLRERADFADSAGADAVVALAESRRRAAIETLSELARVRPDARAALRRTGELAIPVLDARARDGSIAAIDDLAAIATPAAAVTLAEHLWSDAPAARRAAWHLAALIATPDIEAELTQQETPPSVEYYDWLWAPFVAKPAAGSPIVKIVGRMGLLMDRSEIDEVPPDLPTIDPRLALGLGARTKCFTNDSELPDRLRADLQELAARSTTQRRFRSADVSEEPISPLRAAQALDEAFRKGWDNGPELAERVVRLRARDARTRLLLGHLPTRLSVELAMRLLSASGRFDGTLRDWLQVNEEAEPPKVLTGVRNTLIGVAIVLGAAVIGIAATRSVGTLFGWWAWGPVWLALLICVGFGGTIVMIAFGLATDGDEWVGFGVVVFLATVIPASVVAFHTFADWVGWPAAVSTASLVASGLTVFSIWTSRRERALRNPYRAILLADGNANQPAATVIGRRQRGSGQSRHAGVPLQQKATVDRSDDVSRAEGA